jgi:hypothetical protein
VYSIVPEMVVTAPPPKTTRGNATEIESRSAVQTNASPK